jgi:hypothetical protein
MDPVTLFTRKMKAAGTIAGVVSALIGGASFLANASRIKPLPEAYIKSIVAGTGEPDPPKDQKALIKLRNNGGSPMMVNSVRISVKGEEKQTFQNILDDNQYVLLSESRSFLMNGHVGRTFQRNSSIVLCTFRPKDTRHEWDAKLRKDFQDRDVKLNVTYRYGQNPFSYGPDFLFEGKRELCLK